MRKIGILTYHHVANWGSALQAVCIYKLLRKVYPDAIVEIIDYVPQTSFTYNKKNLHRKKFGLPLKNERFYNRWQRCNEFLKEHSIFSKDRLITDDLSAGRDFLERQNYDAIFVGSDTVFQLGPYSGNKYIAAPQAPNVYFLPFSSRVKKIGFAASVDPFRPEQLKNLDASALSEHLNDFAHIFFRDKTTQDVLKSLGVASERISYIPDPSLMIDFDVFAKDPAGLPGGNLAGVAIGNSKLAAEVAATLTLMNYKPLDLLGGTGLSDKSVVRVKSVEEFMGLHRKLRLLVTDRFHGSIKALVIGNCPVIGIEEVSKYPLPNSKLRDLFGRIGIEEMLVRYEGQTVNQNFVQAALEKWRWNKIDIHRQIQQLRVTGLDSLKKSKVMFGDQN